VVALVGGFLTGLALKRDMATCINIETILVSVEGALVVLIVWNAVF